MEAFLKGNGCEATIDEVNAFLTAQQSKEGAVSDAELGNVSGGCNNYMVAMSLSTLGVVCVAIVGRELTGLGKD